MHHIEVLRKKNSRLQQIRWSIIQNLWDEYRQQVPQVATLITQLQNRHITVNLPLLDHFAIIDLPGPHTGISALQQVFTLLGYKTQGYGYLPNKQNAFLWMAEQDCQAQPAQTVLPQVVLADFCRAALPIEIRAIIDHYAALTPPAPIQTMQMLLSSSLQGDKKAELLLQTTVSDYLQTRSWPLPNLKAFQTVQAFNKLLAWVLLSGRCVNHFTLAIHHLKTFNTLSQFNDFVLTELKLPLYTDGGLIKGNAQCGLEQSSTHPPLLTVNIANDCVTLPDRFIEFIWRHPRIPEPSKWQDYFTGFLEANADHVIHSLYKEA